MTRLLQKIVVAIALRLLHAALVELQLLDCTMAQELQKLPKGMSFAIHTGHKAPALTVRWDGRRLQRVVEAGYAAQCTLRIKALAISFRLFTGQMGLAHAYAQHALTVAGEIANVMRLARLVNRAEAYLFPPFISHRILPESPKLEVSPIRVYARIVFGFLKSTYS